MSIGRLIAIAVLTATLAFSQSVKPSRPSAPEPVKALERDFFAALRAGESRKVLAYIPSSGVNVGPSPQHMTREEIEKQFQFHKGIYCKLFDSTCIDTPIRLDNAVPTCSYRELLTRSDSVRTASSEVTRGGVRQAVLVAQVQNNRCPNDKIVDFIFNEQADGWKLFSIP